MKEVYYMKNYGIEDWEVLSVRSEDAKNAKLLATPVTVVVDNKGSVEKIWNGMWRGGDVASASDYFTIDFAHLNLNQ